MPGAGAARNFNFLIAFPISSAVSPASDSSVGTLNRDLCSLRMSAYLFRIGLFDALTVWLKSMASLSVPRLIEVKIRLCELISRFFP